jgi:hypothetical protein
MTVVLASVQPNEMGIIGRRAYAFAQVSKRRAALEW